MVSAKLKGALRWYLLVALSRDSREQNDAAKPSASQKKLPALQENPAVAMEELLSVLSVAAEALP
jgi:hypothetical protein